MTKHFCLLIGKARTTGNHR